MKRRMMRKVITDKLKECPCCGCRADMFVSPSGQLFTIRCRKCSIRTTHFISKQTAIKCWNRRRPMNELMNTFGLGA